MPSHRKCCVRGCLSTREDAILHLFPSDTDRRNLWFQSLKDDDLRSRPSIGNLTVCHKHFEKRFHGEGSRLLMDARPTLLTPDEIISGVPTNFEETENKPLADHNYNRKRHYDHNYCKEEPGSSGVSRAGQGKVLSDVQLNINREEQSHSALSMPPLNKEEVITTTSTIPVLEGQSNTVVEDVLPISTALSMPPLNKEEVITTTSTIPVLEGQSNTVVEDVLPISTEVASKARVTTPTPKTVIRNRVISQFELLTPVAKRIYREYNRAKNQANFHMRAKRALKFSKDKSFEKATNDLNPYAQKFIAMQVKLCKKKKKGRRFSLEEKLIALAIMKQSPKCYRFLHRIFILPSISTLNKMVSNLNIQAGINKKLFELMKKKVSTWKENKKYCSVIFDEMSLGMGLTYDHKKDKINGFVELNERKGKFADHVLVFMVRGAIYKWQQPVAYYFCEGATSGPEIKRIIMEVVKAVAETGLKPIVLGCDQGTNFQSAIKMLQEDTRRHQLLNDIEPDETIKIGECKMNVIFDPSHLIKGIRNNFLVKDMKFKGKMAKWQDIVDVYKTDCKHSEARLLHKLNDTHVIPEKIKKMKVKNCVRVLSKTTSAALSYTAQFSHYVDGTPVSNTMKNTAEAVNFLDDLFDSINGASTSLQKCKGKTLKTAVQEGSHHHSFWIEAIKILQEMRFVDADGNEKSVPSLNNFITTLKSYMKLWQLLKGVGIKIMRPRYFNTDPIENFFGQVRAYNYRNNDPTCHNFINTFKSLTITRVLQFHSDSFNCEDDSGEQLLNLQSLFKDDKNSDENDTIAVDESGHLESSVEELDQCVASIMEQARSERLKTHSRAYTTGWVIRKILQKTSCSTCKNGLTSTGDETIHKWISHREYKQCKNSKKLSYPSEKSVRLFGNILMETNEYLEQNAHETNLRRKILNKVVSKYSIDLVDCTEHQALVNNYFLEIVIRFGIFNWCNIINKIFRGVDITRLNSRTLPHYQSVALKKYQKKLKNKSFNK